MAMQLHVSGEARVRTGTGAANALEDLAVCVNGVTITFSPNNEDVIVDTFGPTTPFDIQQFLATATIEAEMVFFDEGVWERAVQRSMANASWGTMPPAGTLLGQSGSLFRVLVLSPYEGIPYNFPACYIADSMTIPIGTRRTLPKVTFKAIPYTGLAGTSSGAVLVNRATV